jgi:hypothetical protein
MADGCPGAEGSGEPVLPGGGIMLFFCSPGGCSSVVERHVANVNVEGSSPFTRS